jgi:mono/diheme cytochrome c family protein
VQIHDVITNGRKRGANVMPAWKGSLSDDDIWRITAFIRSLGGQPRAQP